MMENLKTSKVRDRNENEREGDRLIGGLRHQKISLRER